MKIKQGFMLRKVAGNPVVVAIGPAAETLRGIIKLNDSGAMMWEKLKAGAEKEDLIQALVEKYEISAEQAAADVDAFVASLQDIGCVEA